MKPRTFQQPYLNIFFPNIPLTLNQALLFLHWYECWSHNLLRVELFLKIYDLFPGLSFSKKPFLKDIEYQIKE